MSFVLAQMKTKAEECTALTTSIALVFFRVVAETRGVLLFGGNDLAAAMLQPH